MVENGSHGYYSAYVARDVIEQYFKLGETIEEDRTAVPYIEQQN